jgi:hypothetical protein
MIEPLLYLLKDASASQRTGVLRLVVTCNRPVPRTFTLSVTVLAGELITIREGNRQGLAALHLLREANSVRSHQWLDLSEDEDLVTLEVPAAPTTLSCAHAL